MTKSFKNLSVKQKSLKQYNLQCHIMCIFTLLVKKCHHSMLKKIVHHLWFTTTINLSTQKKNSRTFLFLLCSNFEFHYVLFFVAVLFVCLYESRTTKELILHSYLIMLLVEFYFNHLYNFALIVMR